MPCNGDRGPLALRSASRARAVSNAFGLSVMTALIFGPCLSYAAMRARYRRTSFSDVSVPALNAASKSAIVATSKLIFSAHAGETATKTTIATSRRNARGIAENPSVLPMRRWEFLGGGLCMADGLRSMHPTATHTPTSDPIDSPMQQCTVDNFL